MKELYKTNDPIKLSYLQALLEDRRIRSYVMDSHTSIAYGGALMEQRLMVSEEDFTPALRILENAQI